MAKVLPFKPAARRSPGNVLRKVSQRIGRPTDLALGRTRSHLTPSEVKALIAAAGKVGRYPERDRAMLTLAYRHGLRVSELVALRWDAVDYPGSRLHVTRLKSGTPGTHTLQGDELRALRALQKRYPDSRYIFTTERGGPLTRSAVAKIVTRAGEVAKIGLPVTPHMLRHSCGYALANKKVPTRHIQAHLGHKAIQHTVRYTALADEPLKDFRWD